MKKIQIDMNPEEIQDVVDTYGVLSVQLVGELIESAIKGKTIPIIPLMVLAEVIEHNLRANTPDVMNAGWDELRARIKITVKAALKESPVKTTDVAEALGLTGEEDESSLH